MLNYNLVNVVLIPDHESFISFHCTLKSIRSSAVAKTPDRRTMEKYVLGLEFQDAIHFVREQ